MGKSAVVSTAVSEQNTAKTVGSGNLDVFSTPMMIALMEQAACECIAEGLEPGQTSVGTEISVAHTAASPLGAVIMARAIVEEVNGRKIAFKVIAKDEAKEIGVGTHSRVIIDAEKFMGKLCK